MFPANRRGARDRQAGKRRPVSGKARGPAGLAEGSPVLGLSATARRAGCRPESAKRQVRIHNGHPRLWFDRRAVITALRCLDLHAAEILGRRAPRELSSLDFSPAASPGVPPGELSLAFLTDPALARLHATFLADASKTDVITFAGDPASGLAGEICLSADAARTFAAKHGRDFSEELTLYLVHGWLHLAGHNDLLPANKKRMRAAEARALAVLHARQKIPRFGIAG